METIDDAGLPARRKVRKPPRTEGRKAGSKVKLTLVVTAETAERITVHAHRAGLSKAALVDRLAADHLRRYVVADRGAGGTAA
jgi:hypothetical protein